MTIFIADHFDFWWLPQRPCDLKVTPIDAPAARDYIASSNVEIENRLSSHDAVVIVIDLLWRRVPQGIRAGRMVHGDVLLVVLLHEREPGCAPLWFRVELQ